jgi:hypothetical protein
MSDKHVRLTKLIIWPVQVYALPMSTYFAESDIVTRYFNNEHVIYSHYYKFFETVQLHLWAHYFPLIIQVKKLP